jgi:hypothetical protein
MEKATAELKDLVKARGSRLMELHGVGPVGAPGTLADVGDIARFADRNRFASWTGTAPLDASSGEQNRHRLSRAGNRRMNHMLHIAGVSQTRLDTAGRAYCRRKLAARNTKDEALRCLWRRISDATYRPPAPHRRRTSATRRTGWTQPARAREGTAGRLKNPARSACPRISTLRVSQLPRPANPTLQTASVRTEALPFEDGVDHRLTTKGREKEASRQSSLERAIRGLSALVAEAAQRLPDG